MKVDTTYARSLHMASDYPTTICARHSVETNIACSRCADPICPKCMVYTPVGNKCEGCATIGGPEMFKVGRNDIIMGAAFGTIAAIGIGVTAGILAWSLWNLPYLQGSSVTIWWIVIAVVNGAGAIAVGEVLRRIVGLKYANSLRILVAALALVFFAAEIAASSFLLITPIVLQLPSLAGLAIGAYYAMNRFKAP